MPNVARFIDGLPGNKLSEGAGTSPRRVWAPFAQFVLTSHVFDDNLQLTIMASQQRVDETLEFMRTYLASRHDAESIGEEALKNKPNNDDIRHLLVDKILTARPFTPGHQVVFCTIRDAARAITLAFHKLHENPHTTRRGLDFPNFPRIHCDRCVAEGQAVERLRAAVGADDLEDERRDGIRFLGFFAHQPTS